MTWKMPRAEAAAIQLREQTGTAGEAFVDLTAIASTLRAEIVYEGMGNDVSGMLVRERDRIVIGVNADHSENRQRFTVAHELGHLVLHRGRPLVVDAARINLRDRTSSLATDLEEIEANSFAAELLMPRAMVLRDFRKIADADGAASLQSVKRDLAVGYGVSDLAMEYRLANLGLLRPT